MSRMLGSPSSLIDVALRTAERPGVEVEVTHLIPSGRSAATPDVASAWALQPPQAWPLGEAFTSYGPATAMHVRTRRVARASRVTAAADTTEIRPDTDSVDEDWWCTSWLGLSPGDPDFLFDFADKLDVLLTLAPDGWHPSPAQSLLLTDALTEATTSAGVRAALPVTFLRSPSAGFSAAQLAQPVDGDDPLLARGATLRLTVGLDRADEGARVTLLQSLTAYARRLGYGLRVADRRYGSISGKWIVLQRLDPAVLAVTVATAARRAAELGRHADDGAALVTVIGPSRMGSFAAVAAALAAAGVVVRAVTCLSSQDLSIIHTEVGVRRGGPVAALLTGHGSGPPGPVDLFELVRLLAPGGPDPAAGPGLHAARGYQCLFSGPYRPVAATSLAFPVWASWEVRDAPPALSETGTAQALVDRFRSHPLVAECRVEYQRFRRRSLDQIAERLKLAVALLPPADASTGADADERVAEVCLGIQQAMRVPGVWRPHGLQDQAAMPRLVSFRVSPKERWLGTWLDDPR